MSDRVDELRLRLLKEGRDPYVELAEAEAELERLRAGLPEDEDGDD